MLATRRRGLLGRKVGMTRVFDEAGRQIPVTVVQAGPCVIVRQRTMEKDGYSAVQMGYGRRKPSRINKPLAGYYRKVGLQPAQLLREFAWDGDPPAVGSEVGVDIFEAGQRVDVTGTSKGKGFAGVIKRHHSRRGPMTHGSKYHRRVGSLNAGTTPARVFKGRQMPGRMGARRATVQALEIVRVDSDRQLLLVRGAVPGIRGALVAISASKKSRG